MDTPLPGTYACVRTGGFYAWLIRIGTRSKYNHAFIVVDTTTVRGPSMDGMVTLRHPVTRIIEADPGGARWSTLDAYAGCDIKFCADVLTDAQREDVVSKASVLVGTPYGWTDIARLALRCMGVKWQWLTRAADNERAMICSQLVAACGEFAGLDWNCGREAPAAVTPGDLADRIG